MKNIYEIYPSRIKYIVILIANLMSLVFIIAEICVFTELNMYLGHSLYLHLMPNLFRVVPDNEYTKFCVLYLNQGIFKVFPTTYVYGQF